MYNFACVVIFAIYGEFMNNMIATCNMFYYLELDHAVCWMLIWIIVLASEVLYIYAEYGLYNSYSTIYYSISSRFGTWETCASQACIFNCA